MFNTKNYKYNCTSRCSLREHGNAISAALTKHSIPNEKLAAYVAKTCCNYANIVDDLGRSAVHVAASVGRYHILEWLLNQGSIINGCDLEFGSSPLHSAIFYGCIDCAVLLLRYGASLDILDAEMLSPLMLVCRVADYPLKRTVTPNNELLVWGSNKNYNLGVYNDQGIDHLPHMLDYFRKEHISIQSAALGAYHSLFLDKKTNLYAVGHGKGGRLGTGNENSLSIPKKIKITLKYDDEQIICISVSRKHSLILTNYSAVFACGINDSLQLGVHNSVEKCLNFKEVFTLTDHNVESLKKVIARDYHSLAYSDNCLYVWGTNVGQMFFDADTKIVRTPKLVKLPKNTSIELVAASNTATVVLTKNNIIILFHKYKIKFLHVPNFQYVKSISVIEGDNDKTGKGSASALKLLILTESNMVFLWYELTKKFYRCSFTNTRLTQIDKIFYKGNQILILSKGDIYRGKSKQVAAPPHYENDCTEAINDLWSQNNHRSVEIAKDFMIHIDLQRIIQIDRAVDVFCDDDFTSFAALQESSMKYFELPVLNPEEYAFKKLYIDVCEYDAIHDVIFYVDGNKFPAHRLIVYARAPGLKHLLIDPHEKKVVLHFPLLTAKMFELVLKFVYSNYLPNEQDIEDIQRSLHPDSPIELIDVCKIFLGLVEQFEIAILANYLKYHIQSTHFLLPNTFDKSKYRFNRLQHTDFPELYDVRIICENNEELWAHKCVLVGRLEYFELMFQHNWAEQRTITLSTVPIEYMRSIVEFLYNMDVEYFRKQHHGESFLYNMIVFCDHFLIQRLKKICEILILGKISIRKCGDMLDFACMYNCELMKKACLDFICQNLARILLQKSLFNCEPDSLKCINDHYRQMFKGVGCRAIITDSDAIDDECLCSFVDDFCVDLNYRMDENEQKLYQNAQRTKSKESKSKITTRQYEREAISSMMESLNVAENSEKLRKMSEKSQKEYEKEMCVEHVLNPNEVIKVASSPSPNKDKDNDNVIAVKTKSPERDSEELPSTSSATKLYKISLAELITPPKEKQRKRLMPEGQRGTSSRGTMLSQEMQTAAVPQSPNAWGVAPLSSAIGLKSDTLQPAPTGSSSDPTSFANMIKSKSPNNSTTTPATTSVTSSFSEILAEEKRQRDYYERTKHKSLALTQIEEQAIAELERFYNVHNVTDEVITIRRKPIQLTNNFVVWQKS